MNNWLNKYRLTFIFAMISAILVAWIDTRPNWDDTGITAGLIFMSTAICGAWFPNRAWLWSLILGGTVFGANVLLHGNYGSLIALVIAFIGAYVGAGIKKLLSSEK